MNREVWCSMDRSLKKRIKASCSLNRRLVLPRGLQRDFQASAPKWPARPGSYSAILYMFGLVV